VGAPAASVVPVDVSCHKWDTSQLGDFLASLSRSNLDCDYHPLVSYGICICIQLKYIWIESYIILGVPVLERVWVSNGYPNWIPVPVPVTTRTCDP
jgi:hypothetical protein